MASEVARGSSRRGRDRDILRGDKINWPWRLNAVVVCIGAIGSVWMLLGGEVARFFSVVASAVYVRFYVPYV